MRQRVFKDARAELEHVVLQIAMVSHVSAASLEPSSKSSDEDIGGKRPPGGVDWQGDREPDYRQKSAAYFVRRLRDHPAQVDLLLVEARGCLDAWRRTLIPEGQEPEFGSPQWKRWVAESLEDGGSLARRFNVSRQYIWEVRRAYRDG